MTIISKQLTYLVQSEEDSSNDSLNCSVCCSLPNRPKMMPCCKRTLCTLCAMTWLQSNTTCPFCRKEMSDSVLSKGLPDSIFDLRALNAMRVECPCKPRGCPWTGVRRDVFGHLKLDCQPFSEQSEVSIDEFGLSDGWSTTPTPGHRTPTRSGVIVPEVYPSPASLFTNASLNSYEYEGEYVSEDSMDEVVLEMDELPTSPRTQQPVVMFRDEGHLSRPPRVQRSRVVMTSSSNVTIKDPRGSIGSIDKWKVFLVVIALAAIIYALTRIVKYSK